MNMEFDPRDQELQKQWQKVTAEVVAPVAATIDSTGEIPESLLRHLDEMKVLTPFLPAELGGEDRGLQSLCILLEEVARHSPVTALLCAQQVVVGIRANLRCFNLTDRTDWAKKASQFKAIFTLAASENEAGSDLAAVQTTCRRTAEGEYLLTGEKAYVNWAARAAWIIALARTHEQEGRGFSLFAVPGSAVGLEFDCSHPTMGLQGIAAAPVRFREVKMSAERLAGVYGFGFDPYDQMLNEMRICTAAIAVGLAQQAYDDAAAHAKTRKQFGKPVGSFQSLQWRFADAATRCDAARLHVWRAVELASQKTSCATQAAMAKVYCSEAAGEVVDFAVQVLGGKGYLRGNTIERLYRDARFLKIGFGTVEKLRDMIVVSL